MITFPNAKINLGLNITGKLPDGFHTIETVMVPVPLCDALEVVSAADGGFHFTTSGLQIDGAPEHNLCLKALHLLKEKYPVPAVLMHLHKVIPSGAGLGGGSADGAFTLGMLNELLPEKLSQHQLGSLAAKLGNDCPFFILNQACFATGTGTVLSPVPLDLSAYHLLIVKPAFSVNTGWAYSMVKKFSQREAPDRTVQRPLSEWKDHLFNAFEEIVFERFPEAAGIKERLYELGAVYASMSGSGSAMYGIFEEPVNDPARLFPNCFVWAGPFRKDQSTIR